MNKNKTALVLGATGLTGNKCLEKLLVNPNYLKVIVLVRQNINLKSEKLEQHIVDFNQLANYSEKFQVNDVFCCLGTTIKKAKSRENFENIDLHLVVNAAKISKQANVDKFIVISAIGAGAKAFSFYSKTKGCMEDALKALNLNQLIIFRPSLLLGKRNETRLLEGIGNYIFKFIAFLFIGSLKRYRPIAASTLAEQMLLSANDINYKSPVYLEVESISPC